MAGMGRKINTSLVLVGHARSLLSLFLNICHSDAWLGGVEIGQMYFWI